PMSEIEAMDKSFNPRDLKMRLAKEIVSIFYNEKKSKEAQDNWEKTFSKKEIPEDAQEIKANKNELLVDVFIKNGIVTSKSEFRRLVENGAVTNMENNKKATTTGEVVGSGVYKIGKKRFCKIII
ncbi:MAG: tyrosine--tRNA ligase, partial [Candidatus Nomurabacteria bacterium]|nr:tyrosine--tRNA ligase [Candidatus Nomurabacteria bacterium]